MLLWMLLIPAMIVAVAAAVVPLLIGSVRQHSPKESNLLPAFHQTADEAPADEREMVAA